MQRRTAIRNVVIISAGAVLLPSCVQQDKPSVPLKNLSLTGAQEKMLAELAETIIPETNSFIGAKGLKAHEFVLTMVDDCMAPGDQQQFISGMQQFEEGCEKKWNSSFVKCTSTQRKDWLQMIENKQDVPENAAKFYTITKRYTVQSFTSSKSYMTDIRKYKMVPGNNYKGCVAV